MTELWLADGIDDGIADGLAVVDPPWLPLPCVDPWLVLEFGAGPVRVDPEGALPDAFTPSLSLP